MNESEMGMIQLTQLAEEKSSTYGEYPEVELH